MVRVVPSGSLLEFSDGELVEQACAGSRDAFDVLVSRHDQHLAAVIHGLVEHPQDAEDVIQDALIRAWRAMPRFRGESAFPTWLHRIAVNTALDFRRRRLRARYESIDRAAERELEPLYGALALDPGPEQCWQQEHLRRVVMDSIAALAEPERSVLVLRALEDASTARTAKVLGMSEALVRWRLHRARKCLRARLARTLEIGNGRGRENLPPSARVVS